MLRLQVVLRQQTLWIAGLGSKVVVIKDRIALIITSPLQTLRQERMLLLVL